jgi:hypothetical protein
MFNTYLILVCLLPGKARYEVTQTAAMRIEAWRDQKRQERQRAAETWRCDRSAAQKRWQETSTAYARDYYGDRFFDYQKFLEEKDAAREAHQAARRAKGDEELIKALKQLPTTHELYGKYAVIKCLIGIVQLVSGTARLYASAAGLGEACGVSERTASTARKWLEDREIIEREESGGINLTTGRKTTNKYHIRYNVWRDNLGIDLIKQSKYERREIRADGTVFFATLFRPYGNVYFNQGYARYSQRGVLAARRLKWEQKQLTGGVYFGDILKNAVLAGVDKSCVCAGKVPSLQTNDLKNVKVLVGSSPPVEKLAQISNRDLAQKPPNLKNHPSVSQQNESKNGLEEKSNIKLE